MLRFSMQLKILIFAIPFIIMVIWHFLPQKKNKEEEKENENQSSITKEDKDE